MSQCVFCGGELTYQLTTFVYEDGEDVWVIRHVPAYVCHQCGEKEYTQQTTGQILAFLKQPPRPSEILHIPAYDWVVAA
jgi:YgiT-type zinc finger domain-containing protein